VTPLALALTFVLLVALAFCARVAWENLDTWRFWRRCQNQYPLYRHELCRKRRSGLLAVAYTLAAVLCVGLLFVVWEVCR
jgi:hypothetical protein